MAIFTLESHKQLIIVAAVLPWEKEKMEAAATRNSFKSTF
jgi:hypothetical protein